MFYSVQIQFIASKFASTLKSSTCLSSSLLKSEGKKRKKEKKEFVIKSFNMPLVELSWLTYLDLRCLNNINSWSNYKYNLRIFTISENYELYYFYHYLFSPLAGVKKTHVMFVFVDNITFSNPETLEKCHPYLMWSPSLPPGNLNKIN